MTNETSPEKRLTLEELNDFLELTLAGAERACANGLRFDLYEPRHRYVVLKLRVVLDHARDVVGLNMAARFGAVAIITRSALDAYADIANLGDHATYWEHLVAADASSWKPLLERASQGKNPVLKAISEDDALPVGRRHYAKELKALQAKGVQKLDIWERFRRAGPERVNEFETKGTEYLTNLG